MSRSTPPDAKPSAPDITEIYNEHSSALKGFIAKRVPLLEDAEDILQNVFYQLARIDLIENPIEQITAWLYSVARNQIIDRSRKKREMRLRSMARSETDEYGDDDLSFLMPDTSSSPDTQYLKAMIWTELEESLGELPPEQWTVFELTELQGFSFKEISESTGIPVNTLLSRKRYAVLFLREKLDRLYDELINE